MTVDLPFRTRVFKGGAIEFEVRNEIVVSLPSKVVTNSRPFPESIKYSLFTACPSFRNTPEGIVQNSNLL